MIDMSEMSLDVKREMKLSGEEDNYKDPDHIQDSESQVLYNDEKLPSVIVSILLAIQAVEVKLLNVIWLPLILTTSLCIHPDDPAQIKIISIVLFTSGLSTLIFNSFGFRLPVIMLPNPRYYTRMSDMLRRERKCPGAGDIYAMGHVRRTLEWEYRIKYIRGGFVMMSLLQVFMGISGITNVIDGVLSNPLVFIPTMIMIGLSYTDVSLGMLPNTTSSVLSPLGAKEEQVVNNTPLYCIILITVAVILLSAFKLRNLKFLVPNISFAKGCGVSTLKAFQLFPILMANFTGLLIFPIIFRLLYGAHSGNALNVNAGVLDEAGSNADRFILHTPFQFSWPEINLQLIVGLLPDTILNIVTSMLIYRTTRFVCEKRNPSKKFVRKAVISEGIVNLISGIFGMCSSSSAANIGVMKLTKVASKRVMQISGLILILISFHSPTILTLSKISIYHLQTINYILAALITAVGLSMLRTIDTSFSRSFTVIGMSLYAGLILPKIISPDESTFTIMEIIIRLMSSNIIICICSAVLIDFLLPGKGSVTDEDSMHSDQSNTQKKDLSFCEELVAICF